ncbi:ATPase [Ignicoccus pacificus DSM 13166]|uniref:ATPase n=1 Tax=Ignicoccus pacificus DSM 13166 TaxID=940294 RepID=A0A977KA87_9CREN|nr:ATPase [Ignicoccus pacificus DSM 13166]
METQFTESVYMEDESVGYVVGETSTTQVVARYDGKVIRGKYVIVKGEDKYLLGLIEDVRSRSDLIEDGLHTEDIKRIVEEIGMDEKAVYAKIRLLAELDELLNGKIVPPRTAPHPGAEVRVASDELLRRIFTKDNDPRYIRIGTLAAHPNVPFFVNLNQIVTRHLAILAVTGAGKSNTVTVLSERIARKGGIVVIFDMHGEYSKATDEELINTIKGKINPNKIDHSSFVRLLNLREAPKQELYIRNLLKAWNVLYQGNFYKDPSDMLDALSEMLEELMGGSKLPIIKDPYLVSKAVDEELRKSKTIHMKPLKFLIGFVKGNLASARYSFCKDPERCMSAMSVLDVPGTDKNSTLPSLMIKLEDMKERYKEIIDFAFNDIIDKIEKGKINVVDLSTVDEDAADVIVSTFLKRILFERKRYVQSGGTEGFKYPLLVVLEEAHILAPRDRSTSTKHWAARVAREGRKFGVGICLVSQRPKNVDQDTLSQANNMIILRLIEPSDQKHVQASSESLSDDLLSQLPSLATGEGVVLGPMTTLPALVKIDKAEKKVIGADIDVVKEWQNEERVEVEDIWSQL